MISILSLPNSFDTPLILEPRIPIHVPTGSIRPSIDSTTTLDFSPGILAIFLMITKPSKISGISKDNNFSKNKGSVRDNKTTGLPHLTMILTTRALMILPLAKLS